MVARAETPLGRASIGAMSLLRDSLGELLQLGLHLESLGSAVVVHRVILVKAGPADPVQRTAIPFDLSNPNLLDAVCRWAGVARLGVCLE